MQPLSAAPIQAPISMLEKTPGLLELLLRHAGPFQKYSNPKP